MGNFNHLPPDIQLEIITRLPAESILDCKLVCKPWRDLVSYHPSFCQLYLSHLNHSADSGELSFLVLAWKLYHFEYNENNDDETPTHEIRRFNLTPPFTSLYNVLGSFNGLVCLYEHKDPTAYCICNPLTREYVMLPQIKRDCDVHYAHRYCGFGYLPLINEYKVVELYIIRREHKFIIEVDVYTLGSGNGWRNVGRFDIKFGEMYVQDGVFVNGALHWRDTLGGRVLVFDLTEEKFSEYISPPPLPQDHMWYEYCYTIGEFGGVLYLAINLVGDKHWDIWLLKEKNDNLDTKEQVEHEPLGWRKEFSLLGGKPLAFTKSGGVLCLDDSSLSVYDAITSTSKKLLEFIPYRKILPHKNTLVSLKELGEEEIKIMKSAEIEEKEYCDLNSLEQNFLTGNA